MNLVFGMSSILSTFNGELSTAAACILLALVADGLDETADPDEGLETVADGLDEVELDDLTAEPPERVEVEPEDLVDAELEDEREELDHEEDEDPVEPLCEVVVVDLRV